MTAEQLEAARAERMRQNGDGAITIEDVRTWIEETGLCIFLPRSTQAGQSILMVSAATPTFVEAVAGERTQEPTLELIRSAESLLVRLEAEGVAVRLNLAGQPLSPSGDQPDYVVAGWVLPYIYALRGDRDWRRSPQLTGSRQVSQLAVLAAKQIDSANMKATEIRDALGREVTEAAVLRALHELWKQLRIIPVVPEVGVPALWQPLRQRFQKAIAEGASTSQVTAISVLASIYLQAVIAASMEDIEAFLSPLTSRSKIREVVRGLAATRQVHTTTMGTSPMFYVAGTLPEFPAAPTYQISPAVPSYRSSNYRGSYRGSDYLPSYPGHGQDEEVYEAAPEKPAGSFAGTPADATLGIAATAAPVDNGHSEPTRAKEQPAIEARPVSRSRPAPAVSKPAAPRPRASRSAGAAHPRERSRTGANAGEARPSGTDRRRSSAAGVANGNGTRGASSASRPARNGSYSKGNGSHAAKPGHSNGNGNGTHGTNGHHSLNGKAEAAGSARTSKPSSNGWSATRPSGKTTGTGAKSAGGSKNVSAARPAVRPGNRAASAAGKGTASRAGATYKSGAKPATGSARSESRKGVAARSGARPAAAKRTTAASASRKPAASAAKRYSFSGQAKQAPKTSAKPAPARAAAGSAKAGSKSSARSHAKPGRSGESKRRG